jgi:hypothetical protein
MTISKRYFRRWNDHKKRSLKLLLEKEKQRRICASSPSKWVTDLELIRDPDDNPVVPDPWQVQMLDSQKKRIILNIHRQGGKSAMSSLKCLHKAIFKPKSLSLIVAPALRQSQENFKKIQDYISMLPKEPDYMEHTKLSLQFGNGSRILCLPGGNEGRTIRGFSRPDIIVEDESAQCSDMLYDALAPMMTTFPDCQLILCSTPFGQVGHFYKIWNDGGKEWLKVRLTAPENPRISKEFLDEQQRDGTHGPLYFQQEYLCEFVANDTQLIDLEMIKRAQNLEVPIIAFG